MLGGRSCVGFSLAAAMGVILTVVHRLPSAAASPLAECRVSGAQTPGVEARGLNSCGVQT